MIERRINVAVEYGAIEFAARVVCFTIIEVSISGPVPGWMIST